MKKAFIGAAAIALVASPAFASCNGCTITVPSGALPYAEYGRAPAGSLAAQPAA